MTSAPSGTAPRVLPVMVLLAVACAAAAGTVVLAGGASPGLGVIAVLSGLLPVLVAGVFLAPRSPGPVTTADLVTLTRLALTGGLIAATVLALADRIAPQGWLLLVLAAVTLVSDAIDGPIARRTGTAGPIGARLDMEADAALLMVLSVLVSLTLGPWVLAIGLIRYLFVAASRLLPFLARPLAFSQFRRVVAALQGVALVAALAPALPHAVATALVASALALLLASFGRDIVGLARRRSQSRRS